jgi:hypothetical protein
MLSLTSGTSHGVDPSGQHEPLLYKQVSLVRTHRPHKRLFWATYQDHALPIRLWWPMDLRLASCHADPCCHVLAIWIALFILVALGTGTSSGWTLRT